MFPYLQSKSLNAPQDTQVQYESFKIMNTCGITRGWGGGESLSLFSSLFISRSLPSRRIPLPERLEQAKAMLITVR